MGKFDFDFAHLRSTANKRDANGKMIYTLFVVFLLKTAEEQRDAIMGELESIEPDGKSMPEVNVRPMEAVPWIRNYDPPTSILFDICREGLNSHIFVDSQTLIDNTVIITNWFSVVPGDYANQKLEAARVPARRANLLISDVWLKTTSFFPRFLSQDCRMLEPPKEEDQDWEVVASYDTAQWNYPAHLPQDMKLNASSPTLISMVHLFEDEIEKLKSKIGSDSSLEPVQIYNWPDGAEPASRVDMWRIFDQVKPEYPYPYQQVFGFFVDSTTLHDQDREPEVIVVDRRQKVLDERKHDHIMRLFKINPDTMISAWKSAWSPTGRAIYNGCRENESIKPKLSMQIEVVGNPDVPTIAGEPFPVFFLGPVTESQIRALRAALMEEEGEYQFIRVPNGDDTLEGLLRYFESLEFRRHEMPPWNFIAIDQRTLSALPDPKASDSKGWQPEDCSVILASASSCVWRSKSLSISEYLGYGYGRTSLSDGAPHSAMQNLSIANMDLFELIDQDDEDDAQTDEYGQTIPRKVYWSTFTPGEVELYG